MDNGKLDNTAVCTAGNKNHAARLFTAAALSVAMALCGLCASVEASSAPDAVLRASGNVPPAKTAKTEKDENELKRLATKEKQLKEQIQAATINRSKILAQKRSELKLARHARDEAINKDITSINAKKTIQADLLRDLKNQLSTAKKNNNKIKIASLESSIKTAEKKLEGYVNGSSDSVEELEAERLMFGGEGVKPGKSLVDCQLHEIIASASANSGL